MYDFGAILGSYVGTKLRNRIDGKKFAIILKIMLTFLAINLIFQVIIKIFFKLNILYKILE